MNLARNVKYKCMFIACLLFILAFLSLSSSLFAESSSSTKGNNNPIKIDQELPYSYSDRADLRIVVITCNRSSSLLTLLKSLDVLVLDNYSAALEIWIDRNRKTGMVDEMTVNVASEFRWSRGPTRVHIHAKHVGLHGQWIDTWRPHDDSDDELALFLEDDLTISRYAYRWVRAVFQTYSHRADFAGASLTSHQMIIISDKPKRTLVGPKNHTAMMYKCFSSWGFAPKPMHWRKFQVGRKHRPMVCPLPGGLACSTSL